MMLRANYKTFDCIQYFKKKTMSEVFDLCEGNFYRSIRIAQKGLKSTDTDQSKLDEINQALSEANQELNKMEIEYSLSRSIDMKNKISLFKDELRNYKRDLTKKTQEYEEKQQENSGPLLEMETQEKGIDPLIEAKRQMYENEGLANEAAMGLRQNNQKLMKNIEKMDDINNQLTVAQKLIGSIHKKLRKNKFVLWGTIGVLVLVVVFVIYTYL